MLKVSNLFTVSQIEPLEQGASVNDTETVTPEPPVAETPEVKVSDDESNEDKNLAG